MTRRHVARPKRDYPKRPTPPKWQNPYPSEAVQRITDHAVIRYIERVIGVDVQALRDTMLAGGRAELIRTMGTGRLHTPEGATLVVVGGKVVSVLRSDDLKPGAWTRRAATD